MSRPFLRCLLLFLLAFVAINAVEQVRYEIKDPKWNDALSDPAYYTAMAEAGVRNPTGLSSWMDQPDYASMEDDVQERYFDSIHASYSKTENGLANQPPYAYRVLVPASVSVLASLGVESGWRLLHTAGLALFFVCSYRVYERGWRFSVVATVASIGPLLIILSSTGSMRGPDGVYYGLSMLAVAAAIERRLWLFVLAGSAAVLTRELAMVLPLAWIIMGRADRPALRFMPALAPLMALIGTRLWVEVPNGGTDYFALMDGIVGIKMILVFAGATIVVGLTTFLPAISPSTITREMYYVIAVGVMTSALAALMATNTTRMSALMLPLFIGVSALAGHVGPPWAYLLGGLLFAVADTISANTADGGLVIMTWGLAGIASAVASAYCWRIERQEIEALKVLTS